MAGQEGTCDGPGASPRAARAAVATVFFINGFVFANWVPRIAEVQRRLALSEGWLGVALLAIAIGALLAMPLSGRLSARHGSRAVARLTVALYGLSLPVLALASGFASLTAALFAFGAAAGALDVAMNAQGAEVERRYRRPIMSSLHGMFSLGAMVGAAAAGIAAAVGLTPLPHFLAIGLLAFGAGVLACHPMLPAATATNTAATTSGPPTFAAPDRAVIGLGALAFCALLGEGAVADWSAVYMSGNLQAGATVAAAAFAAFSLAMAAGRFAGDRFVARFGGAIVVRAGGALALLGLGGTLLVGEPAAAVAGFGLVGAGLSCVFPVVLSAAAATPGVPAANAIAAVCTLGYLGFLVGPPVIGLAADLVGLPRALCMVVALTAAITALGGRAGGGVMRSEDPSCSATTPG